MHSRLSLLLVLFITFAVCQLGIDTSDQARAIAAEDYGNLVHNLPEGVATPSSVAELSDLVQYAESECKTIAAVGQAHSVKGQAQALDGIVVNMTSISNINVNSNRKYAWVGAGATWRELLEETLVNDLSPPIFTDYIDLSIGGTLSVGGIGSQSFRTGFQIDNVLELRVMTSGGVVRTCSPTKKKKLFNAVLGGLGQFGIIVEAKIPLVDALPKTRYVRSLYVDIDDFLDDLFLLVNEQNPRYDGVQGFVVPNNFEGLISSAGPAFLNLQLPIGDYPYLFMIEGSAYYEEGNAPSVDYLTAGLKHIPENAVNVTDPTYYDFIARLDPVEAILRETGLWYLPHPMVDVFVPRCESADFITYELSLLGPQDVNGPILVYPYLTENIDTENFPLPEGEEIVLFALLRTAFSVESALQFDEDNDEIASRAREVGGTGYSIDAVTLEPTSWENHFGGKRYSQLEKEKRKYDPSNLFSPGQFVFPNPADCATSSSSPTSSTSSSSSTSPSSSTSTESNHSSHH